MNDTAGIRVGPCGRRGWTLIEVLVVVAVLVVLMGLTLPVLRASRSASRQAACLSSIRASAARLTVYAAEHRDVLPFAGETVREWGDERTRWASLPLGGLLGFHRLYTRYWVMALPAEEYGVVPNRGYRCPDHPAPDDPGLRWNSFHEAWPATYDLTWASWLDATRMTPGSLFEAMRVRANLISDVAFPTRKAFLFTGMDYCATGPGIEEYFDAGSTYLFRSSTAMFDGSAFRYRIIDGERGRGGAVPFFETVHGLKGIDIAGDLP